MNRYLIRALVAVLTFSIGLAVGSLQRPTRNRIRENRCKHESYTYSQLAALSLPSPSMSIENPASDPLRLSYSFTKVNPTNSAKRLVELVVENQSGREISSYAIGYNSRSTSNSRGGGGAVSVTNFDYFVPFVSINCDADQLLTVWVSSVNYKDGSRWVNPQYSY
jgi:hypothetical protein